MKMEGYRQICDEIVYLPFYCLKYRSLYCAYAFGTMMLILFRKVVYYPYRQESQVMV